jgi:hypothetical protein
VSWYIISTFQIRNTNYTNIVFPDVVMLFVSEVMLYWNVLQLEIWY